MNLEQMITKLEKLPKEHRVVLAHVLTLIDNGQLSPLQVGVAARMLKEGKIKPIEIPSYLRELETLPVEEAS